LRNRNIPRSLSWQWLFISWRIHYQGVLKVANPRIVSLPAPVPQVQVRNRRTVPVEAISAPHLGIASPKNGSHLYLRYTVLRTVQGWRRQ
jgi:hypothetical protein